MNAQCQALADISRLVSIMVYSWCISKKFSYLSIVVGLARGVDLTLITKKKKKKVTDIYGVHEYRHLFIPLLSVHAFGIQYGWRPVLETAFKFQIIVHLIAWRKNKVSWDGRII